MAVVTSVMGHVLSAADQIDEARVEAPTVVNDQVSDSHERFTLGEGLQARETGKRQFLEVWVVVQ